MTAAASQFNGKGIAHTKYITLKRQSFQMHLQ